MERSLLVGSEVLPQAKELKYLGVLLFTSDGKMDREMDRRFSTDRGASEGAKPEGEALHLQVHLRPNPHLWS